MPLRHLVLAVAGLLSLASVGMAQPGPRNLDGGVDDKLLAKTELAASRAKPSETAQATIATAELGAQERAKEVFAGKTTPNELLLAALQLRLETELTVAERAEDRLAARLECWMWARVMAEIVWSKYLAGNVSPALAMATRHFQLKAEEDLRQQLLDYAKQTGRADAVWPVISNSFERALGQAAGHHPAFSPEALEKPTAKALFALRGKDAKALRQEQLDAARSELAARWKEVADGKTTPNEFLLESAERVVATLAAGGTEADVRAAHEVLWHATFAAEQILAAKYAAGNVSVVLFATASYEHDHASLQWRKAAGTSAQPMGSGGLATIQGQFDHDQPKLALERDQSIAKAQWAVMQQTVDQLAKARLDAARMIMAGRLDDFRTGRSAPDLGEANDILLAAELALATSRDGRLAALLRYWETALLWEQSLRTRYESGNVSMAFYANALYQRQHAEWLLAQERAK
jgi:hypothetical protein